MERKTSKKVVVSKAAMKRSGRRVLEASAKLEGRSVPAGYKRPAAVDAYLAARQQSKR